MVYLLTALYILAGLAFFFFSSKDRKDFLSLFKNFSGDPLYVKLHPILGALYVSALVVLTVVIIVLLASLWPMLALIFIVSRSFPSIKIGKKEKKDNGIKDILLNNYTVIPAKDNPLGLDPKWVFYVEPEYNELINRFIRSNYKQICKEVGFKGCEFVYFPYASKKLLSDIFSDNYMHYNFPQLSNSDIKQFRERIPNLTTADFSRFLMQGIGYTGELECGFIRKSADPEIRYQKLKPTSKKQLKHMTESYINNIGERNQCFYRMAQGNPENMAEMSEWSFNYEANKLAKEIVENIEKLKQHGYEQMLLNYLNMSKVVEPERFSKLSRLHITKDYRVLLPDFQNLEISLTPLPKTVFLLFIRHPEGIVLKYLSDYRDELLEIYKQISLRENYNDIISSIDELVNPTKNSINEKCSRIKEAFVKHFSENIANFYYITGERGQPKQIKLDRNLVQWDGTEIPLITNPRSAKEIEQIEDDIYNNLKAGRDKSQQKDFITAIEHFSNVITLAPYHGNAYAERALAFSALGKYHDSERDNSAAIEIDKEILYAFHNRAEDRLFLENYKGALEDINHYLSLKTECKDSYFLRGLIYEKTGNLEMACRDWLTAKKLGREGMDSYLNNYPNIKVRKIKRKV